MVGCDAGGITWNGGPEDPQVGAGLTAIIRSTWLDGFKLDQSVSLFGPVHGRTSSTIKMVGPSNLEHS